MSALKNSETGLHRKVMVYRQTYINFTNLFIIVNQSKNPCVYDGRMDFFVRKER